MQNVFTGAVAARYDEDCASISTEEALSPMLDALEELAGGGAALEFAIGTGRVGLPLAARGVTVSGIELSEDMVAELRRKSGGDALPVVIGDMATTMVDGTYSLVYLVFNTLSNLIEQDEQVACFANAAAHLAPGGRFVIEQGEPDLRRFPPGALAVPFEIGDEHLGFDTYDLVTQQLTSHPLPPRRPRAARVAPPLGLVRRDGPHGAARRSAPTGPLGRLAPHGPEQRAHRHRVDLRQGPLTGARQHLRASGASPKFLCGWRGLGACIARRRGAGIPGRLTSFGNVARCVPGAWQPSRVFGDGPLVRE